MLFEFPKAENALTHNCVIHQILFSDDKSDNMNYHLNIIILVADYNQVEELVEDSVSMN